MHMKQSILFKHHQEIYKKIFGTIPFTFEKKPILYLILFLISLSSLFLAPKEHQFLFSGLFITLCLVVNFIHTNLFNKAKKSFAKEISLELRQTIARNILNEFDSYLENEKILITEISKPVIENLRGKIHLNIKRLLSDDLSLIENSFIYFFEYREPQSFTHELTYKLKYEIYSKEKEFKKDLIESKSASLGEERLKALESSKSLTTS